MKLVVNTFKSSVALQSSSTATSSADGGGANYNNNKKKSPKNKNKKKTLRQRIKNTTNKVTMMMATASPTVSDDSSSSSSSSSTNDDTTTTSSSVATRTSGNGNRGQPSPVNAISCSALPAVVVSEQFSGGINQHEEESIDLSVNDNDDDESFKYSFRDFVQSSLDWKKKTRTRSMAFLAKKDALHDTINQDYTELLLEQQSLLGVQGLAAHFCAANHLLHEFVSVLDLIRSCPGMASSIEEMIFCIVDDFIRPRIADHYRLTNSTTMTTTDKDGDDDDNDNDNSITPGNAAQIISWIDFYLETSASNCPDLEPSPKWTADRDMLFDLYLNRGVRREMKLLLSRSANTLTDDDIRTNPSRTASTGQPNEIAFMVNSQIAVAQEILPAAYTEHVLAVCNEELSEFISGQMLKLGSDWKDVSSICFAATINDAARLAKQTQERNAMYLQNPTFVEAGETLRREFTELAMHATTFLCEHIMFSLREPEPILNSIGDKEWESDDTGSTLARTIATLKDYFHDIEAWLSINSQYYPKVLQNCFNLILQTYVESFFANTMINGISDPARVANELNEDYLRFVIFFNGANFEPYHGISGFDHQQTINSRLHIIQCLSRVIDPQMSPDALLDDVKAIMCQIDCYDSGAPAVLHLAGLRKRHTAVESIEWLRVVAHAKKKIESDELEDEEDEDGFYRYTVPDLRNSTAFRNLKPVTDVTIESSRRISMESRPIVKHTSRLLAPHKTTGRRRIQNGIARIAAR